MGAGNTRMPKLNDGLARAGEVLPFARAGQEFTPTVGHYSQQHIATNLRAMYDELVQQPLPDRFVELLHQLDTRSEKKQP
jgi:hypothetical protein